MCGIGLFVGKLRCCSLRSSSRNVRRAVWCMGLEGEHLRNTVPQSREVGGAALLFNFALECQWQGLPVFASLHCRHQATSREKWGVPNTTLQASAAVCTARGVSEWTLHSLHWRFVWCTFFINKQISLSLSIYIINIHTYIYIYICR